jgi:hypothetical protein
MQFARVDAFPQESRRRAANGYQDRGSSTDSACRQRDAGDRDRDWIASPKRGAGNDRRQIVENSTQMRVG